MKHYLVTAVIFAFAVAHLAAASLVLSTADGRTENHRNVSSELFKDLEELARLVDISYCVGTTGVYRPFQCLSHCSEFDGFELITSWDTGPLLSDSCGYIALSHPPFAKRIIVAFRGTYSLTNTIIDLSAIPQAYVPYPADGGGDDDNDDDDDDSDPSNQPPKKNRCTNCTVHAGFWTSWKTARLVVLPAVAEARAKYPDYEVVLVGHSLGGAVAALAGLEMQLRGWGPRVTTFGEPRVGNQALAQFIDEVFDLVSEEEKGDDDIAFRRVTHINDPIPLLPLEEWGYQMHAGEIYISKLDLPPSVSDLERCDGDADVRCIAGADGSESLALLDRDLLPLRDPSAELLTFQEQQQPGKQWSLIPSRYRLWQLFLAHRDYFWRLGLCVPGGDPGPWR
ncbi:hypothetical protein VTN77DRAFT_5287 [Rasamsonia byssochlamydoides]|uniref:uncharacterized protein n=1 Tax=Rasamsonia byssochlamydoides TaxID=89139 RepID=UPI0037435A1B